MGIKTAPRPNNKMGASATVAKALVRPEYSKYVEMDIEGLDSIRAIRESRFHEPRSFIASDRLVGSFGIADPTRKGAEHLIYWKISGTRKDKRHGCVNRPEPLSYYATHLMEEMFKGWHNVVEAQENNAIEV